MTSLTMTSALMSNYGNPELEFDHGKGCYLFTAAGERYLPEGMPPPQFYQPVERGLEIRIAEKMRELAARNQHKK